MSGNGKSAILGSDIFRRLTHFIQYIECPFIQTCAGNHSNWSRCCPISPHRDGGAVQCSTCWSRQNCAATTKVEALESAFRVHPDPFLTSILNHGSATKVHSSPTWR